MWLYWMENGSPDFRNHCYSSRTLLFGLFWSVVQNVVCIWDSLLLPFNKTSVKHKPHALQILWSISSKSKHQKKKLRDLQFESRLHNKVPKNCVIRKTQRIVYLINLSHGMWQMGFHFIIARLVLSYCMVVSNADNAYDKFIRPANIFIGFFQIIVLKC